MLKIVAQAENDSVLIEVEIAPISLGLEVAIAQVEHRLLGECHSKVHVESMLVKVAIECL